ncbi:unnamed protein product [Brassica rapa subsp. trilocularis]
MGMGSSLEKLFKRERTVHEILGGGIVADVMLWRKKNVSVGIATVTIGSWMVFETFSIPSSLFFQVFFSSCSLFSFSGPNLHPSSTGRHRH